MAEASGEPGVLDAIKSAADWINDGAGAEKLKTGRDGHNDGHGFMPTPGSAPRPFKKWEKAANPMDSDLRTAPAPQPRHPSEGPGEPTSNLGKTRQWEDALWRADVGSVKRQISQGIDVNKVLVYTHQQRETTVKIGPLNDRGSETWQVFPIVLAAGTSHEITAALLAAGADANARLPGRPTALETALNQNTRPGIRETVRVLIEGGADVNSSPGGFGTALMLAARLHDVEPLRMLIKAGADVNYVIEESGETALRRAVRFSNEGSVRTLLYNGAQADVGLGGDTPTRMRNILWHAVARGNSGIVKLLLKAGARSNSKPVEGQTAVEESLVAMAAKTGDWEIVKLLVEFGADIDDIAEGEETALVAAGLSQHVDLLPWLLTHGASASVAEKWWIEVANETKPLDLKIWAWAEKSECFHSVSGILDQASSIRFPWLYREVSCEWEIPEFIRQSCKDAAGTTTLDLDREIFLTTTAGHPRTAELLDPHHRRGHTRAYTWGEIRRGLDPLVENFLGKLLDHVGENLDGLPEAQAYEYYSTKSKLEGKVRYDNSHIRLYFRGNHYTHDILSSFLLGIEVICATLRPARPRHEGTLGVCQWTLQRYETSPQRHDAPSMEVPKTYRIRPVMSLGNQCLPEELKEHGCWKHVFDMGLSTVVSLEKQLTHEEPVFHLQDSGVGQGLEMTFEMMITLAAVEFPLVIGDGVVFIGYETVLVPVAIASGVAQFHLITRSSRGNGQANDRGGQINPYAMDLGPRVRTEDIHQFCEMRCFLGWCKSAQINLGTEGLRAEVNYTNSREKERSLQLDGYAVLSQFGASSPLNAVLGFQTNFKYTSHRLQFTPLANYKKLLLDTARELAIMYDSGARRCWLVPKLSLLLHMAQAYAIWTDSEAPYVDPHADATALLGFLDTLGEMSILEDQANKLLFRELILALNMNLLATVSSTKRSSGKKLYGFEFMDVVTSPSRGSCMKELTVSSLGRNWLDIANVVDAVVVCSGLGDAISPAPTSDTPARPNPVCKALPEGMDYLAATIPCLNLLAYRCGGNLQPGASRIPISQGSFWDISGDPFMSCSHGEGSCETCWEKEGRKQRICKLHSFTFEIRSKPVVQSVSVDIPIEGAVAFGGVAP